MDIQKTLEALIADLSKARDRREMLNAQLEQAEQHEQRIIGGIQVLQQLLATPESKPETKK